MVITLLVSLSAQIYPVRYIHADISGMFVFISHSRIRRAGYIHRDISLVALPLGRARLPFYQHNFTFFLLSVFTHYPTVSPDVTC